MTASDQFSQNEIAALQARLALDSSTRLGELLIQAQVIGEIQLQEALATSISSYLPIGRVLVLSGIINDEILSTAVNAQNQLRLNQTTRDDALRAINAANLRRQNPLQTTERAHFYQLPRRNSVRLGALLIAAGAISQAQLDSAVEIGLVNGLSLGQVLIELGLVEAGALDATLAMQKMLMDERLNLNVAVTILFRICHERISFAEALSTYKPPAEKLEQRTLLSFLQSAGKISDDGLEQMLEFVLQDAQTMVNTLNRAKILDEQLLSDAFRCQQLWRNGAITLEVATAALKLAETNHIPINEALQQLHQK